MLQNKSAVCIIWRRQEESSRSIGIICNNQPKYNLQQSAQTEHVSNGPGCLAPNFVSGNHHIGYHSNSTNILLLLKLL